MRRFMKYFLVMLLPLGVLLIRPATPALVLFWGDRIRLSTEPVDPRDVFRGDYVELRFAIEEVDKNLMDSELQRDFDRQTMPEALYVLLSSDSKGIYSPVGVTKEIPSDGIYIKGRPRSRYGNAGHIRLNYGQNLSRFYVRENTGLELERLARQGDIVATAKVWKGRVVLENLDPAH